MRDATKERNERGRNQRDLLVVWLSIGLTPVKLIKIKALCSTVTKAELRSKRIKREYRPELAESTN